MISNGNGKAHSLSIAEAPASFLETKHLQHLVDEGFTDTQIMQLQAQGVRSLSEAEAESLGFRVQTKDGSKSGPGLYFPFSDSFAQLRLDAPIQRDNGQRAKYLTPVGAKSQALLPDGCKIITEGAKDSYAGSVHGGIPTGALAGVSHYRKALPQGAGYTIIFDSDGWYNPSVFLNLFHAGKYLKGKIQLVPEIPGEPKGGLCEYFKAGYSASDYAELINSAMKPEVFLLAWPTHFGKIPAEKVSLAILTAFRLAAEYLNEIETELLLNGIRKATKLSAALLKAELEKQRRIVAKKLCTQERKSQDSTECDPVDWSPSIPEAPKPSASKQAIERRANQLLDSGVLFDLVKILVDKSGAVGIGDHVQVALASTIGTFRLDRRRSMPTLFTGSSGIGKSMILDALEALLPLDSCLRVSGVSDAVLKRIGDTWKGKIIAIDEFSTWASSDAVLSTLKELISRGEASFEISVPGETGWSVEHFSVEGPIGIAACATEATISTIFGDAEEEIRSRFNEIPLPEDPAYIQKISRAAFSGLEPENLAEKYPRILEIIHRAIAKALSREVPKCDPLLEDALFQHVQPDRPLFPRLLKRLKILLENTSVLLGKNIIDLETYSIVYPLVSKVFRRSLTSENDATLAQFAQMGKEIRDVIAGGYLSFKVPKIQDALSCSKPQAYRFKDKWDSLGWIENTGYATYSVTAKGVEVLKGAGSDNPGLPEILPPVDKLAATMKKLAESRGIPAVFSGIKASADKVSEDFILTFSQVFSRFSQGSKNAESLIDNTFKVDTRGEFSQILNQERESSAKKGSEPSEPTLTLDTQKEVFSEGSLIPENLRKPQENSGENLGLSMVSADKTPEKTLRKPGESPRKPEEDVRKLDENSQGIVSEPKNLGTNTITPTVKSAEPATECVIAPTPTPVTNVHSLEIGDRVTDSAQHVTRIVKLAAGGWMAEDGRHISRDDLRSGIYTKVSITSPVVSESTLAVILNPDPSESASILIGFAEDIDNAEVVRDITQNWTPSHKKQVWGLLMPDLKEKYKALMKG